MGGTGFSQSSDPMMDQVHDPISVPEGYSVPDEYANGISKGKDDPSTFYSAAFYMDDLQYSTIGGQSTNFPMTYITPGGAYKFGNGTLLSPAISWLNDPTDGLYRIGSHDQGYVIGGALVTEWKSSEFRVNYLTPGSVVFAGTSGKLEQDNASFFWNDTSNFLKLESSLGKQIRLQYDSTTWSDFTVDINGNLYSTLTTGPQWIFKAFSPLFNITGTATNQAVTFRLVDNDTTLKSQLYYAGDAAAGSKATVVQDWDSDYLALSSSHSIRFMDRNLATEFGRFDSSTGALQITGDGTHYYRRSTAGTINTAFFQFQDTSGNYMSKVNGDGSYWFKADVYAVWAYPGNPALSCGHIRTSTTPTFATAAFIMECASCDGFSFQHNNAASSAQVEAITIPNTLNYSLVRINGGTTLSGSCRVGTNLAAGVAAADVGDLSAGVLNAAAMWWDASAALLTLYHTDTAAFCTLNRAAFTFQNINGSTGALVFGTNNNVGTISLQNGATAKLQLLNAGDNWISGVSNDNLVLRTNNTSRFTVTASGCLISAASLATGMTTGFFNIPGAAGAASGTPVSTTGFPLYYDSTLDQLGIYNTAWKWISAGTPILKSYTSADQTVTNSTTLTDSGQTVNVLAGKIYEFTVIIFQTSASVTAGISLAIAGTCTATSIKYEAFNIAGTPIFGRSAALGTRIDLAVATGDNYIEITGTIEVNAAGTLKTQFAQRVADALNGTVFQRNSVFEVIQVG